MDPLQLTEADDVNSSRPNFKTYTFLQKGTLYASLFYHCLKNYRIPQVLAETSL